MPANSVSLSAKYTSSSAYSAPTYRGGSHVVAPYTSNCVSVSPSTDCAIFSAENRVLSSVLPLLTNMFTPWVFCTSRWVRNRFSDTNSSPPSFCALHSWNSFTRPSLFFVSVFSATIATLSSNTAMYLISRLIATVVPVPSHTALPVTRFASL